ncbi:hypothetical protein AWC22_21895 [Mycobacterium riyadhense]|uniref:Uncharacterized protein n=1 Tax=Mycobacterium riyadhense TaxID=486698 RepID=A0A1X2CKZ8_9MYCO|nr:hypothetical protein AWC22_21895 [Mycobacterium riyadhense]
MYAPLVIVPDAGVTNGPLAQFDINIRSVKAFKHLQPQVYAPGIVPLSDLQLLETANSTDTTRVLVRLLGAPGVANHPLNGELASLSVEASPPIRRFYS